MYGGILLPAYGLERFLLYISISILILDLSKSMFVIKELFATVFFSVPVQK